MQGVQIDLISAERLSRMPSMEKIRLILDKVRSGTIVILESGLSPEEQSSLIEMTMQEILPDEFSGIEIETYPSKQKSGGMLSRFVRGEGEFRRLTVIGPANQLKMIRRDRDFISAWISSR
ncbi:MAG TPA: DUF2073 domain-containing protein [Methanospirillum sp.]|jgi:uncharacterized protein|uniref:DUF2073 domain-containing protein n=1 Tax=Methanospirillum sp. TaxID=45200 RepID=UPI002C108F00|nr:DUF2073 domain-containing protein [Methanospirillum sp.]HWQ64637.1 DUF2073 domain-containing protein [Methanospirillum sp.]